MATDDRAEWLTGALRSIADGSDALELEVVVVDRGVQPAVPSVLGEVDPRLTKLTVVRWPGAGEVDALRRAVTAAEGDAIRFLMAGTALPSDAIKQALTRLLTASDCVGVYGDGPSRHGRLPLGSPVPIETLLIRRAALSEGLALAADAATGQVYCRPPAAEPASLQYVAATMAIAAPHMSLPEPSVPVAVAAPVAGAAPMSSTQTTAVTLASLAQFVADEGETWLPPACPAPDVSVIIRTHNEPREWLAAAVQSALDQEDVSVEVIVVDDHGAPPAVPFADPRCGLLRLAFNHRLAGARNAGIRHARGRFLRMLDADDQLPPGALARQAYELALHPEAAFCAGRLEILGTTQEVAWACPTGEWCQHEWLREVWDGSQATLGDVLLADPRTLVPGPSVMWRNERSNPLVPLDLVHCDDNAQYRMLLTANRHPGAARWVERPVLRYRRTARSNSGSLLMSDEDHFRSRCVEDQLTVAQLAAEVELLAQQVHRPLKVAYLDWRLDVGGAQWSLAQTAKHLDRRLVQPSFLIQYGSPIVDWIQAQGIDVQTCPEGNSFSSWSAEVIGHQQFDVVDFPWAAKLATAEIRAAAPKLVTHVQSTYAGWAKLAEHDTDVWPQFDGFVAVAEGIPPVFPWLQPMEVIPSPVDSLAMRQYRASRDAVRAALGYGPDDLVVVWTGRIVAPVKRAEVMAEVAREVQARHPWVKFLVLGYIHEYLSEHDAALARWAEWSQKTGNQILTTLPPWQAQRVMAAGDVYLNTSTAEGLSLAMLEAMAAGLAPLVTDVCGAREAVQAGLNGQVVGVDDAASMVSGLSHYAKHPELVREMGARSANLASSRYDSRHNARRHALYYHALVSAQDARPPAQGLDLSLLEPSSNGSTARAAVAG